jgi:hypothetical protein
MIRKKAQSEYAWIFSLVVGAMILFLAIYAASKLFTTSKYLAESEILRSFDNILNPFSSLGSIATLALSKEIKMPYELEMNFSCDSSKEIQTLAIRIIEKRDIGEWTKPYTIKNKYVFSEKNLRGKTIWTFSKAFILPWRVDDMIYIISNDYCFIDANIPRNVMNELEMINSSSIRVLPEDSCENAITVCFTGDCNISIDYNSKSLTKPGQSQTYFLDDASMYAAIFSHKDIYDCNMKRLLSRASIQSTILMNEANVLVGCVSGNLANSLYSFGQATKTVSNQGLSEITASTLISSATQIKNQDNINCPIINK